MKTLTLLCAGACVLLFADGAAAHDTGKPHKHSAKKMHAVQPAPAKDLTPNTGTTRAAPRRRSVIGGSPEACRAAARGV